MKARTSAGRILAAMASVMLLASCRSLGTQDAYTVHTERQSERCLEASVSYPVFSGGGGLNSAVKDLAESRLRKFSQSAKPAREALAKEYGDISPSEYDMSFDVASESGRYLSVLLVEYTYIAGAAHGSTEFFSFTYDTEKDSLISLEDTGFPLPLIQEECRASLRTQLDAQTGGNADEEWILAGTEEDALSSCPFTYDGKTLTVHFGPYTVAPYSSGTHQVSITR